MSELQNTLKVPKAEYCKIMAHGEATYPEECCGVLIGTPGSSKVIEARPMRNTNEGSKNTRYNIDPFDLITLEDELDEIGLVMIGIYHSHPNHPSRPSETDLKFAWPNLSYIVLSVDNGKSNQITSWRLKSSEGKKEFKKENLILE